MVQGRRRGCSRPGKSLGSQYRRPERASYLLYILTGEVQMYRADGALWHRCENSRRTIRLSTDGGCGEWFAVPHTFNAGNNLPIRKNRRRNATCPCSSVADISDKNM